MATRARVTWAIACSALLVTACSDLLGLAPKDEAPADAATGPLGEAGEDAAATSTDDATVPDDAPGNGGGDGGGGGGPDAARPDAAKADTGNPDGNPDPDGGCTALGPVPDGAPQTFYGSCVPHLTPTSVICNQYGYTGNLGVTPQTVASQKATCTTNLKGTWTDGPCNKTGTVSGCQTLDDTGHVCENVAVTWYYPPATVADVEAGCPASVGTVIPP